MKYHINPNQLLDMDLFDLPPHLDIQTLTSECIHSVLSCNTQGKVCCQQNLLKFALHRNLSRWTVYLRTVHEPVDDAGL